MVAYHAKPRFTKDIDIFVDPAADNLARVLLALADFGFGDLGVTAADLTPGRVIQLGMPPTRVDLLTAIDGVSFEGAWAVGALDPSARRPSVMMNFDVQPFPGPGRKRQISSEGGVQAGWRGDNALGSPG